MKTKQTSAQTPTESAGNTPKLDIDKIRKDVNSAYDDTLKSPEQVQKL